MTAIPADVWEEKSDQLDHLADQIADHIRFFLDAGCEQIALTLQHALPHMDAAVDLAAREAEK